MNNELQTVKNLIDQLTDDEDLRQDLWVHFLSGSNTSTFIYQLEVLQIHNAIINHLQDQLVVFTTQPMTAQFEIALHSMSAVEQQILYLLLLGLVPVEIAKYKNISVVKIYQAVLSICSSPTWKKI